MNRNAKLVLGAGLLSVVVGSVGCGWIRGLDEFVDAPVGTGAGGGGGGGGGAGGATACSPGTTESCYGGPAGTEGVGICQAGTRICLEDGSGWGACEGEVLPAQESCADAADENCDGLDCVLWAKVFEESNGKGEAVALGLAGEVYVTGAFQGTINAGADPLVGVAADDVYLMSFDPEGNHRWSKQFGDAVDQAGTGLVVDGEGNVILVGINEGLLNFGMGNEGPGLFVAKFAPDGQLIWSRSFGGTTNITLDGDPAVVVTSTNDIVLAGSFTGTLQLDGGPITSTGTGSDIFVVKLRSSDGSTSTSAGGWARRFGASGSDGVQGLRIDVAGSILLTGQHADGTVFGSSPPMPGTGMFIAKLDANGSAAWGRPYSGALPRSLGLTAQGDILIAGDYTGSAAFDGAPLPLGDDTSFFARFSPQGYLSWTRSFTGSVLLQVGSMSVDAAGEAVVTGIFRGELDFEAGRLESVDEGPNTFVVRFDQGGEVVWRRAFHASVAHEGRSVLFTPEGEIVLAGMSFGTTDFGAGQHQSLDIAVYLARLGR